MKRLDGLDTLRGIAALCVAVYHMCAMNGLFQPFGGGYLAVDFFFVLSGYVMARSYEGRGIEKLGFLRARVARLWPTMAIGVMLGVLAHLDDPTLPWLALSGLLFVPLAVTDELFPINSVTWSIVFELIANALHSTLLCRLGNRALIALMIACSILNAITIHTYGGLKAGPFVEAFAWGLPRVLLSYALGILLCRVWADRPPFTVPFIITIALLPVMLTRPGHALGLGGWFDLVFVLAACPLLIAGGLRHATSWGPHLGAISFPLYAVHYPILTLANAAHWPPLAGLAAAILLAALITHVRIGWSGAKALPRRGSGGAQARSAANSG